MLFGLTAVDVRAFSTAREHFKNALNAAHARTHERPVMIVQRATAFGEFSALGPSRG